MPTRRQLSRMREVEFEFPQTRREDDPAYVKPEIKPRPMSHKQKDAKWHPETQSGTYSDKIHWGELKINKSAMTRIVNLPKNHLAVKVSKSYNEFFIHTQPDGIQGISFFLSNNRGLHDIILPPGQYEIVGKGDQLTEEQWKGIVEVVDYDIPPSAGNDFRGDWRSAYRDYVSLVETGCSEYPFVKTAIESGLSLLSSLSLKPEQSLIIKQVK